MKKLIVFPILLLLALANFLYASESGIIPKTLLILPETSAVKIKWILIPEKKNSIRDNTKNFFHNRQ
jgi:hypothetical protein